MTTQRDIERILDRWLDDGPTQAPDRVLDTVADRIERQSQRPAWRLTWRHPDMNTGLKLAAALAAVAIIAVAGYNLLPGSPAGGPAATPMPSPSPAATIAPSQTATAWPIACEFDAPGCLGLLSPGTHATTNFRPAFTYSTPDGWANDLDIGNWFYLRPTTLGSPEILIWSRARVEHQAVGCAPSVEPGVGTGARDWIDYIRAHPGLVSTEPVAVTIGGASGQSIDLDVAPDWTMTCPENPSGPGPYVSLITNAPGDHGVDYGLPEHQRLHLIVLDVAGDNVVIAIYSADSPEALAGAVMAAQPLLDSIQFTSGG